MVRFKQHHLRDLTQTNDVKASQMIVLIVNARTNIYLVQISQHHNIVAHLSFVQFTFIVRPDQTQKRKSLTINILKNLITIQKIRREKNRKKN